MIKNAILYGFVKRCQQHGLNGSQIKGLLNKYAAEGDPSLWDKVKDLFSPSKENFPDYVPDEENILKDMTAEDAKKLFGKGGYPNIYGGFIPSFEEEGSTREESEFKGLEPDKSYLNDLTKLLSRTGVKGGGIGALVGGATGALASKKKRALATALGATAGGLGGAGLEYLLKDKKLI